jgi:hypothetical protein
MQTRRFSGKLAALGWTAVGARHLVRVGLDSAHTETNFLAIRSGHFSRAFSAVAFVLNGFDTGGDESAVTADGGLPKPSTGGTRTFVSYVAAHPVDEETDPDGLIHAVNGAK